MGKSSKSTALTCPRTSAKPSSFARWPRTQAFAADKYDAAVVLAIHAGIGAVDAICIAIAGVRSHDPDHNKAADLLRAVGGNAFDDQAQRLLRLLVLKNRIEYENKRATRDDADQCTRRCSNLVDSARSELTKARLIR